MSVINAQIGEWLGCNRRYGNEILQLVEGQFSASVVKRLIALRFGAIRDLTRQSFLATAASNGRGARS